MKIGVAMDLRMKSRKNCGRQDVVGIEKSKSGKMFIIQNNITQ